MVLAPTLPFPHSRVDEIPIERCTPPPTELFSLHAECWGAGLSISAAAPRPGLGGKA